MSYKKVFDKVLNEALQEIHHGAKVRIGFDSDELDSMLVVPLTHCFIITGYYSWCHPNGFSSEPPNTCRLKVVHMIVEEKEVYHSS